MAGVVVHHEQVVAVLLAGQASLPGGERGWLEIERRDPGVDLVVVERLDGGQVGRGGRADEHGAIFPDDGRRPRDGAPLGCHDGPVPPQPQPPPIEPDIQDWTWVLDRPCPECGYVAGEVDPADLGRRLRDNAEQWPTVLAGPDAGRRPSDGVWSATEYACHVRDVHRVFGARVRLMLDHDDPAFENWDQDAAAVAERYDLADPAEVGPALVAAAGEVAAALRRRPGRWLGPHRPSQQRLGVHRLLAGPLPPPRRRPPPRGRAQGRVATVVVVIPDRGSSSQDRSGPFRVSQGR